MNGRRIRARRGEDETVGLAGWLYTDLMLGLAVVFLGTIGFTAATKPDESATPTTTTSTSVPVTTTSTIPPTTTLPQPCTLRPEPVKEDNRIKLSGSSETSPDEFELKVVELLNARSLPADTRIGFALFFGGGANSDQGQASASKMAATLGSKFPQRFESAAVRPLWDRSVGSSVNVDVWFLVGEC